MYYYFNPKKGALLARVSNELSDLEDLNLANIGFLLEFGCENYDIEIFSSSNNCREEGN